MRIFPPQIEISDDEGFTPEKDIFKREEFFKFHEWNEYQSEIEYVVEKWKVCLIGELHNDSQWSFRSQANHP
jgi:hypothetical protein